MIIELSKHTVTTKDELSFGDMEDMQQAIGAEQDLMKGNSKLIEVAITSIKEGDTDIKYSNEWKRNLSIKDGIKLSTEIQKLVSGLEDIVKKD